MSKECPKCGAEMKKEGERKYQTLAEHVDDRNQVVEEKPYWICPNCPGFIGVDGDWYPYDEDGNVVDDDGNEVESVPSIYGDK